MNNRVGGSESLAVEFKDLQASTLSLHQNGDLALLAGRKYLTTLSLCEGDEEDLVYPLTQDRLTQSRIAYGGKYEISCTQWCKDPNPSSPLVAIASSQQLHIYSASPQLRQLLLLRGHTRVITDLDWSPLHPSLLASSSFDSLVHVWDIRVDGASDKPLFSLSALDGASQVRWNPGREDVLASCDGGHVKIWDLRKPSVNVPSEFVAAHASKINGLEWAGADTVITAAQDCTVKFSKVGGAGKKGPILSLTAPVWRARPAPFGRGVVTQCVPILRRDSGLLSLWDWKRGASPIFTFQAYDIIEFAWRKKQNYDLITWSRDQTLRIWSLPHEIVQLCGGDEDTEFGGLGFCLGGEAKGRDDGDEGSYAGDEEGEDGDEDSPPTGSEGFPAGEGGLTKSTSEGGESEAGNEAEGEEEEGSPRIVHRRSRKSSSPSPLVLGGVAGGRRDLLRAEFEKVMQDSRFKENINFDQVEMEKGLLRFSWTSQKGQAEKGLYKGATAGVLASFPSGYPAIPPTFLVTNASNEVDKNHVIKSLKSVALQLSKKSEQCLGACVQQFYNIMNSIKTLEDIEQGYFPNARSVSNVPFPRTSGARFCAVGMLVCFGRPTYLKRVKKSTMDSGTPRALSALGPYLSQVALENGGVTDAFRPGKGRVRIKHQRAGLVTLFDVSPLLPFNHALAREYSHLVAGGRERGSACQNNWAICERQRKGNLGGIWQAAGVICRFAEGDNNSHPHIPESEEEEPEDWLPFHPLGCDLIHSMITHSAQYGDVQTAATLACLFTSPEHLPQVGQGGKSGGTGGVVGGRGHRQTVPRLSVPKWWTKAGSPYHTVHGSDTHGIFISPETFLRQHRSNSWSDSLDDLKLQGLLQSHTLAELNGVLPHDFSHGASNGFSSHSNSSQSQLQQLSISLNGHFLSSKIPGSKGVLLDYSCHRFYDRYKKSYAEILYRWGLLQQRAEVLKNLTEVSESNTITRLGVEFTTYCRSCEQLVKGPYCSQCKRIASICSICHMPAKGLSTFCPLCGHGGHTKHMTAWFKTRKSCPNGCGCNCVVDRAQSQR